MPTRDHGNFSDVLGEVWSTKRSWLERLPVTQDVASSSPVAPANITDTFIQNTTSSPFNDERGLVVD